MKVFKYIFVVITALILINALQPAVSAVQVKSFDEMKDALTDWKSRGQQDNAGVNAGDLKQIVIPVINILTVIGVFVLVAVTIIMGIKYMFATPDVAAKLKQQLIGLVVSAVVVLGATAIWKIVYNVLNSTNL
mgnify:CR=1 FL=1